MQILHISQGSAGGSSPRSSVDRAPPSGGGCAGSTPVGGTTSQSSTSRWLSCDCLRLDESHTHLCGIFRRLSLLSCEVYERIGQYSPLFQLEFVALGRRLGCFSLNEHSRRAKTTV